MRRAVKTGLPPSSQPLEFATLADGILYTAQVPVRPDNTVEPGDTTAQVERTLSNLKMTVEAAGGTLDAVTQVLVYLTGPEHVAPMNEVWKRVFNQPYPQRATAIVAGLVRPGIVIEIVATAHVGG